MKSAFPKEMWRNQDLVLTFHDLEKVELTWLDRPIDYDESTLFWEIQLITVIVAVALAQDGNDTI